MSFAFNCTLTQTLRFSGIGLHSGQSCEVQLYPWHQAGIWLGSPSNVQLLDWRGIKQSPLCTEINGILTWEHLLAALHGTGVNAIRIEVRGPEIPIYDGSAWPFVSAIKQAGISPLPQQRRIFAVKESLELHIGDCQITITPAQQLYVDYRIHYSRRYGQLAQDYQLSWSPERFQSEIAAARTFAFADDVKQMQGQKRALGGSLENAILYDESGQSQQLLRFPNEAVRHKILDFLGDISLLGAHIQGAFQIERGGHHAHATMLNILHEKAALDETSHD